METRTYQKRKIRFTLYVMLALMIFLVIRIAYLMICKSEYYTERAADVQERERPISAERGVIYDRNGTALTVNQSVCTISVIHNQITGVIYSVLVHIIVKGYSDRIFEIT